MSSPGPSISERGGQNSPPRYQQQQQQQLRDQEQHLPCSTLKVAKVSPTVHAKRHSTRSANGIVQKSPKVMAAAAVEPNLINNTKVNLKRAQPNSPKGAPKLKEVKIYQVASSMAGKKMAPIKSQSIVMTAQPHAQTIKQVMGRSVVVTNNNNGPQQKHIVVPIALQDATKDMRTIKIVNANSTKCSNLKLAAANLLQQSKQGLLPKGVYIPNERYEIVTGGIKDELIEDTTNDMQVDVGDAYGDEELQQPQYVDYVQGGSSTIDDEDDDEEDDDDDMDDDMDSYGRGGSMRRQNGGDKLLLTAEEKRLLSKEGITLPPHYPLTKHEERELKRIRRKIRNKISAQDSRKRKKEYVDGLEERVKQCTDENQSLMKRIKLLQSQNHNLMSQMKKLQNLLSKNGSGGSAAVTTNGTTQPATCLMVLLLSMALIAAPNLKLGKRGEAAGAKELEIAEAIQESLKVQQNRRSLLFDSVTGTDENNVAVLEDTCTENDFIAENENFIEGFYRRIGVGGRRGGGAGGDRNKNKGFFDLDLDDTVWRAGSNHRDDGMAMADDSLKDGNHFNTASGMDVTTMIDMPLGDGLEKMDNFLIMELRNNLLDQGLLHDEEGGENGGGGDKENNTMGLVQHRQSSVHSTANIVFQD